MPRKPEFRFETGLSIVLFIVGKRSLFFSPTVLYYFHWAPISPKDSHTSPQKQRPSHSPFVQVAVQILFSFLTSCRNPFGSCQ